MERFHYPFGRLCISFSIHSAKYLIYNNFRATGMYFFLPLLNQQSALMFAFAFNFLPPVISFPLFNEPIIFRTSLNRVYKSSITRCVPHIKLQMGVLFMNVSRTQALETEFHAFSVDVPKFAQWLVPALNKASCEI